MTTAYNKRPNLRGRVYETAKRGSAPAWIQWVEPRTPASKAIMALAGLIPVMVLNGLDLLTVWTQGWFSWNNPDNFGLSRLGLLTSINNIAETLSFSTITAGELTALKAVLVITALMSALAIVLALIATVLCAQGASKARAAFAYSGFGLAALSSLTVIIAINIINSNSARPAIEASPYTYLSLLAALLALVYCARYPTLTEVRNKRNSLFTRMVTTFVPVKRDGAIEGGRKLIFTAALVCFVYFGSTLGLQLISAVDDQNIKENIINSIDVTVHPDDTVRDHQQFQAVAPLEKYLALYKENNEMVGYIQIGDTKINYPVVKATDNAYYLDYNFYNKRNYAGSIFSDYRNRFDGLNISDNTVLYGHNVPNGSHFTALVGYHRTRENLSFYKENPIIQFDTMFEEANWKVFGAVLFNTQTKYGEIYDYWNRLSFRDKDDFHSYILDIMDRSVLFTDVDIEYGDKILTLSTCYFPYGQAIDSRLVVFARKVRPGESTYVDVDKASYNRNILPFDEQRKRIGNVWQGRVWDYKTYLTSLGL